MSRPLRVLIVEDSPDDTDLLIRELQRGGFEPSFERVEDRPGMVRALESGSWDLVISDYRLPGFSGIGALDLVREKALDIPFIIVSGVIGEETAVQAMKAGAHDYLMKGNLSRLAPAIERELREAQNRREQRRAQEEREVTIQLLRMINTARDTRELTQSVTEFLKTCFHCQTVVIRPHNGMDDGNRRDGEGREAAAKIPLRCGNDTVGFLELGDRQKERFTAPTIAVLERLADSLAIGLAHRMGADELRRTNRALRTISDCNQTVVRVTQEQRLLDEICRIITETGGYPLAWVGLAENDEAKTVRPAARAGEAQGYMETLRVSWANNERGQGPTGTAIRTGQITICRDIPNDPRFAPWRPGVTRYGLKSSIALPLLAGPEGGVLGSLNIYSDREDAFDATEVALLSELAGDLAFGMSTIRLREERRKGEERLGEYQEQLRALASELSLAEDRERRRIASELHDQIGQALVFAKMKLKGLPELVGMKQFNDTIEEICGMVDQTIQSTRTLTFDLSSPLLEERGFEAALAEWLEEQVEHAHGIKCRFETDGQRKLLADDVRLVLFKAARELLINVVKHAKARKVRVESRRDGDRIYVTVEDNGMGFDPPVPGGKLRGFGLFSIRERLRPLGGEMHVDSEPGRGTQVTLTAPLRK